MNSRATIMTAKTIPTTVPVPFPSFEGLLITVARVVYLINRYVYHDGPKHYSITKEKE